MTHPTRRAVLAGAGALVAVPALGRVPPSFGDAAFRDGVAALDVSSHGRLGVAIVDTRTGAAFAHRGDERFPMCSTFKAVLAAAILRRIDTGTERLDRRIPVAASDIIAHSPFAATRVGGTASVGEWCAATVAQSDNAAANLLIARVGGPAGLTRFVRASGDAVTRMDRTEPALNTAIRGDPRDTTTPRAMAALLERLAFGAVLSPAKRAQLIAWMRATTTADARLRAQLPAGWRVASKTGTGANGSNNEIALLWAPGARAPLVVASYLTGTDLPMADAEAIHARLGALIATIR